MLSLGVDWDIFAAVFILSLVWEAEQPNDRFLDSPSETHPVLQACISSVMTVYAIEPEDTKIGQFCGLKLKDFSNAQTFEIMLLRS